MTTTEYLEKIALDNYGWNNVEITSINDIGEIDVSVDSYDILEDIDGVIYFLQLNVREVDPLDASARIYAHWKGKSILVCNESFNWNREIPILLKRLQFQKLTALTGTFEYYYNGFRIKRR